MARYTGSVCRLCRREGMKLFLKGERCYSQKCAFVKKPTPPGQHGQGRRSKVSDYGLQLREQQRRAGPTAWSRASSIITMSWPRRKAA